MIIGVTGSRHGFNSDEQKASFIRDLAKASVIIHGACVGVDELMHHYAFEHKLPIEVHPPINDNFRAMNLPAGLNVAWFAPKDYLARNREIVERCELLLAAPEFHEIQKPRSGTWYTINYAKKIGKPVQIYWRDGSMNYE